jgi:hypothetical protein
MLSITPALPLEAEVEYQSWIHRKIGAFENFQTPGVTLDSGGQIPPTPRAFASQRDYPQKSAQPSIQNRESNRDSKSKLRKELTPPTESRFELTQIGADPRDGSMALFSAHFRRSAATAAMPKSNL